MHSKRLEKKSRGFGRVKLGDYQREEAEKQEEKTFSAYL